jgi:hypothetical protein
MICVPYRTKQEVKKRVEDESIKYSNLQKVTLQNSIGINNA